MTVFPSRRKAQSWTIDWNPCSFPPSSCKYSTFISICWESMADWSCLRALQNLKQFISPAAAGLGFGFGSSLAFFLLVSTSSTRLPLTRWLR